MNIITISREFGSGGREVGKRIADLLGYSYYDREIITAIAEKHDFDESEKWNNAVYQDTLANVYREANFYRNDPEGLKRSMANLKATFNVMPSLQKLDPEMRAIAEKQMISQFHEAVLDGKIADNSLSAKEYFEAHKGEISYQKQAAYLDRVNNLGDKL